MDSGRPQWSEQCQARVQVWSGTSSCRVVPPLARDDALVVKNHTTINLPTDHKSSMSSRPPISVLFVCLGNICRSPLGEGVFRSLTASNEHIGTVDSAGIGAYHTLEPPDPRTTATLRKHGITDYDHGARQVDEEDFGTFDYIFAMDRSNLRDLERMKRRAEKKGPVKAQVMLYGKFSGTGKEEEVADPYYGRDNGFETVYEQVNRFATNFLKQVVDQQGTRPS